MSRTKSNWEQKMTSIIIPTCNGLHLLAPCIESIRKYTVGIPYEIIVVDNASMDGTENYCIREHITFISLPINVGFPKACNLGMSLAIGNYLLLLNNDVTVTANWLSNMMTALDSSSDVGMVGPVTNYASGLQKVDVIFKDIGHFQSIAAKNNISDPSRWREVNRIIGMCLLLKRDVMHSIGKLDEIFSPGHFEDDDYCLRARANGYKLLVCHDVLVHHQGSASFKQVPAEELNALLDRNHRLFMDKWNLEPHQYMKDAEIMTEGGGFQ